MDNIIGIIGAMAVEVETIIAQLEGDRPTHVSGMTFHEGILAGRRVVVVQCGIGKVNAAMCAQTLIDRFGANEVINTGVAGALDPSLSVGDLVVSTDLVHHDADVTGLGYEPGMVPGMESLSFTANEHLRVAVISAAKQVTPEITVLEGRIASGDQFVSTQDLKDHIFLTFGALCCEMEGAAIAHVCARNEVPFVVVRTISDNADNTSTYAYRLAEEDEAKHCAAIVTKALELLDEA